MLVTGDFIVADEARAQGLVNRVAAPDALDAEVESLVARDRRQAARRDRASARQLFYRQLETRHRGRLRATPASTMACNMMDEAALEGVQAFIDKRPPAWPRGR